MHRIKSLISIILLLVCISSSGQIQVLHNGFVAATSTGVWYLEDGFGVWLQLNTDSTTGISYNYDLNSNKRYAKNDWRAYSEYGLNNKTLKTGQYHYIVKNTRKNITNKFSIPNFFVRYGEMYSNVGFESLIYTSGTNTFTTGVGVDDFTSMATDNDTTVVIVGSNNELKSFMFTGDGLSYTYSTVTGLTSNASSGFQICYENIQDIFYILSDEGDLYSFDKTSIQFIRNTNQSLYPMDSVIDISIDENSAYVPVSIRTLGNYRIYTMDRLTPNFISTINVGTEEPIISGNNVDKYLLNSSLGEIYYYSGDTVSAPDLPSGTKVYDLDYIEYLPCDRGFYFYFPIINDTLFNDVEYEITWGSCKTYGNVYIYLHNLVDGEYPRLLTIIDDTANDGSYLWTPTGLTAGNNYVIYIEDNYYAYTYSDTFRIQDQPLITVTYPTYGATLNHGNNYEITWTSQEITGNVKLELFKNDVLISSEITLLPANTANDGSYIWNAAGGYYFPTLPPGYPEFKIRVTSLDTGIYGESELFNLSDNT